MDTSIDTGKSYIQEFTHYVTLLTVDQQRSLLNLVKTFVNGASGDTGRIKDEKKSPAADELESRAKHLYNNRKRRG